MDLIESMDSSIIRVDNNAKKGSALDVVRLILECKSGVANIYLTRLLLTSPELATNCSRSKGLVRIIGGFG